jgi:hypothetical protein
MSVSLAKEKGMLYAFHKWRNCYLKMRKEITKTSLSQSLQNKNSMKFLGCVEEKNHLHLMKESMLIFPGLLSFMTQLLNSVIRKHN